MKIKLTCFLILTTMLSGCPLNDDGAVGEPGAAGEQGATGAAGLNCWDLNENSQKDLPSEDVNSDGLVDILDCRAPNASTTPLVRTYYESLSLGSYTNSGHFIELWLGSLDQYDAYINQDNIIGMNDYIAPYGWAPTNEDYLDDTILGRTGCKRWKWNVSNDGVENVYSVKAVNATNYKSIIYPKEIGSTDIETTGAIQCRKSCLDDNRCVAATYALIENTNSIQCNLLYDTGIDLPINYEYTFLEKGDSGNGTAFVGFLLAQYKFFPLNNGIISVCEP
jgi:hypothetical protein